MRSSRFQQVEALFGAVRGLPRQDARDELARLCGGDPELRREVEELLEQNLRAAAPARPLARTPRVKPYPTPGVVTMNRRQLLTLAAGAPAAAAIPALTPLDPEDAARRVLAAALSFGRGGGYDRSWKGHGVPADVEHDGARILSKGERGSYCCGFTFAAAMKALAGTRGLARLSAEEARAFQKAWFGASAAFAEKQCADAVERFRLGKEVSARKARAGDFCQLWRRTKTPSGHSVLFLSWIELAGERAGLCYLSSQGSTDGIGYGVEFFADSGVPGGRVDPERTYFARLDLA